MRIRFNQFSEFEGRFDKFPNFIQGVIAANRAKSVYEIGAGANPALRREFVEEHHIEYTALDVEASEMAKAAYQPNVVVCDICKPNDLPAEAADLVFSRMVCEHFSDSVAAHRNIWHLLKPGGIAVHCFATLYTLPFLLNRLIPERLSRLVLHLFVPTRKNYEHDKFVARYKLCRGPLPSQISKLEALGFEVCEYTGTFGHRYYGDRLKLLHWLEQHKTRLLLKSPHPLFTAYATVVLRKPMPAAADTAR